MSLTYADRFNVLNTYKDSENQKILLASEKKQSDSIVLINIIKKRALSDSEIIDKFKFCIGNLVYSDESEDEVLIATLYKKGYPISKYIQYYHPLLKTRINFVYEYLSKITRYDCLQTEFIKSLVQESQVIIDNNEVLFNDLLILDGPEEKALTFTDVCGAISQVINCFLFGESEIPKNTDLPKELRSFLFDLKTNERKYKTVKNVFQEFKSIYLYDLYLDDSNSAYLMKDVKSSIKSSGERPQPVYRPINAFIPFSDESAGDDFSGKGSAPEEIPDGDFHAKDDSADEDEGLYEKGQVPEEVDDDFNTEDEDTEEDDFNTEDEDIEEDDEDIEEDDEDIEEDDFSTEDEDTEEDEDVEDGYVEKRDVSEEGVILNDYISETLGLDEDGADEDAEPADSMGFEDEYVDLFAALPDSPESTDADRRKNRKARDNKVLAFILIAAFIGILLTICSKTDLLFFKDDAPVTAFEHERLYDEWIFRLGAQDETVKGYEWIVSQSGEEALSGDQAEFRFKETDLAEGEFSVSLRILDDKNHWSKSYSNNYYNIINDIDNIVIDPDAEEERLDALNVEYADADSVTKDDTVFRNGAYSLRIGNQKDTESTKLTLEDLFMDNHSVISMWILSDSTETFKVQLIGYNGKDVVFKRSVNFKPNSKNYWELLSISQETNNVDRLEIIFSNLSSRIWVDDLDINSYK